MRWSDDAEARWGLNSPVLSRDLRASHSGVEQTESFFGALLPEGAHVERLARDAKTASNDLLGLLRHVGADLAGALRIGDPRDPREPERLTTDEVAALLQNASGFLVGGGGSALPGFQRKLTLIRQGGQWWRGNGTFPSTHILKPVEAEYRAAIEGEHYVLQIARRLGLAAFDSRVETIGDLDVLVIERYDRRISPSGAIERLHQEDAGQALGPPWGGNDKFELRNPAASLRAVAGLLDATGRTRLAPFYDGAPLALDFSLSSALAMRINGVSQLPDVTAADLVAEAESWGVPADSARDSVAHTLEDIVEATRAVSAHPSIEKHVPGYVRGQAENMAAGRPARTVSAVPLMAMPRLGTPATHEQQERKEEPR